MANKQRIISILAAVAVLLAVIAIAALVLSSRSTSGTSVASLATATVQQDVNSLSTQIYGGITQTAVVLAVTNQAGTIAAMQETISAPTQNNSVPQQQGVIASPVPQQPAQAVTETPSPQPQVVVASPVPQQPVLVVTATPSPQPQVVIVTPTSVPQQSIPTVQSCDQTNTETNLPDGSSDTITVAPNSFDLWIAGENIAVAYNGQQLGYYTNSPTSGITVAFLPLNNQSTTYTLTSLHPRLNYHAVFQGCGDTDRTNRINALATGMFSPPNCGAGQGCATVRLIIVQGGQVVSDNILRR